MEKRKRHRLEREMAWKKKIEKCKSNIEKNEKEMMKRKKNKNIQRNREKKKRKKGSVRKQGIY